MAEEAAQEAQNNSTLYYVIGVLVLVLVLGVGYALRPKPAEEPAGGADVAIPDVPIPTIARGPINGFACDNQYYNTVIGLPEYFLSVEGVDVEGTDPITCDFSVTVADEEVAAVSVDAEVSAAPDLGGVIWRCTPEALELPPNVPATVDATATNAADDTANCSATFLLPSP